MICTGFESYTDTELASHGETLPNPVIKELAKRLLARDAQQEAQGRALEAARTLEERVRDLCTAADEDNAAEFMAGTPKRLEELQAACEAFKEQDDGA